MRTFILVAFLSLLVGCAKPQDHNSNTRIAELRNTNVPLVFSVPDVEKVSLENGSELYLKENHELPLVQFTLMTDGGALYEPVTKKGLTSLMAASMRSGGAGDMSPDQYDAEVEQLAADLDGANDGSEFFGQGERLVHGRYVESDDDWIRFCHVSDLLA